MSAASRQPRHADGRWRLASLLAVIFLVTAAPALGESPHDSGYITKIQVEATPIASFDPRDDSHRQFGALRFRGGLVLSSSYRAFGGLSSLHIADDGVHFITASDRGRWFRGRIVYDKDRPVGLADVEAAPMLGEDGRPLAGRGWFDTESLTAAGGMLYVGIERVHQIVRFDYGRDGFAARGEAIAVPPGVKTLPANQGLEALAAVPADVKSPLAGTLIAVSERGLDDNHNIKAFLIGGPSPGEFRVRRTGDFDVSDAALLPDGDLLLLERRFAFTRGLAMRIRRIPIASIKPGAVVDGPELIFADMGYEIDNMEGLGVHTTADGDIVLTLVSDDNFLVFQRTLLLQFTLMK